MTAEQSSIITRANPGVAALRPYQPGKAFDEVKREFGITDVVKLASNENPRGPSPLVVESIRQELKDISRYPDSNAFRLKEALANKHQVLPECITVGNGSNDVLEIVARVFLRPGSNAVFSRYAFAVYPMVTQAVGAECRVVSANASDHNMPYGHDLSAMAEAVDENTRVVFIANPNNPTGTWLTAAELAAFLQQVPRSVIIVIDEAYFEYVEHADYPDASCWLERFPNLMVTRTFSKAYGLASLRVGYAISHPSVSDLLNRVRQPFNVNTMAQSAALAALRDNDFLMRSIELNRAGMQFLTKALSGLGVATIPSAGNFICADIGRPAAEAYQALLALGVIVRPVDNYGLSNFLRITVGLAEENQRFIAALGRVLDVAPQAALT